MSPSSIFGLSARLLENSLLTLNSAIVTAQRRLDEITGAPSGPITEPPVDGPQDTDIAVSDFATRIARILRYTVAGSKDLTRASSEIVDAAKRSFGYVDLTNPRYFGFPAQLALSVGTLAIQSALRGMATYEVIGPEVMPRLLLDFFEMYTELGVFVGLEYRKVMDQFRERLTANPDDQSTRIQLGRMLIKCGLYEEAEREFGLVPEDSSYHQAAMHELAVALLRAGRPREAAAAAVRALDENPNDERIRFWLWLTAQQLGGYPPFVVPAHRMEVKAGWAEPTITFEDIAERIGFDKTSAGRGIAIFDYNNDGYLDIVVSSGHGGINLYRNNGNGTFTDVSIASGLDTAVNVQSISVGDYDNDGNCDLFITRLGFYAGDCQLFRNNGDGTFSDVTEQAGLKVWGPTFVAAWVDYDGDGFLDLFIANNLSGIFDRKAPNRLFHNNGDGTFTETTEQAGLKTIWPTTGAAWFDYDNDGRPDLFLSNGVGRSQLFHNNGDGTFEDVSEAAGVTEPGFGSPVFSWDFDNDGWMDIGQFQWSDHEDMIYSLREGEGPPNGRPFRLYKNNRDGTFTNVSRDLGLTGCYGSMSGSFGDFNNDGHLDIVYGNGSPKMDRMEPMIVMENRGGRFQNVTFSSGLPFTGKSHGVTVADLFGDGRLSILVGAGGQYPGDLLTTTVYCPTTLPGNYVNVRLVGTKSNRSAVGARVSVEAGGTKQHREISGGTNFGCLPLEQHFGLGSIASIDAIIVRWPSGLVQRFSDVPINKTWEFIEGRESRKDVYAEAAAARLQRTTAATGN